MDTPRHVRSIVFWCVALAMTAVACTSNGPASSNAARRAADSSSRAGTAGSSGSPTGGAGAPAVIFLDGGPSHRGAGGSGDASPYCAATAFQAEQRKLDVLILMDGSGSMNNDVDASRKWDLLVDALRTFVNDPSSAGIGVALTYFGLPAGRDDAGELVVSCNAADYAKPAVALSDLPGNAAAIVSSLSAYAPVGGTPTRPALAGAEAFAQSWLAGHPTHRMIIVLATDGEPNDCASTVEAVSAVAAQGASRTPSVQTYVIGVGRSLTSLDAVATAGGTGQAYLVDTAQDTTARFTAAMNAIRGRAALSCEYALPRPPDGGETDPSRVNVRFTPSADGGSGLLLQVPRASACDAQKGGWYYDDPTAPKNIELCAASCTRAKTDFAGRIDVLVGCRTQTVHVK